MKGLLVWAREHPVAFLLVEVLSLPVATTIYSQVELYLPLHMLVSDGGFSLFIAVVEGPLAYLAYRVFIFCGFEVWQALMGVGALVMMSIGFSRLLHSLLMFVYGAEMGRVMNDVVETLLWLLLAGYWLIQTMKLMEKAKRLGKR